MSTKAKTTRSIPDEMEALTIEQLYGVINRCRAENTIASLLIASWAQQVIDRKFGG